MTRKTTNSNTLIIPMTRRNVRKSAKSHVIKNVKLNVWMFVTRMRNVMPNAKRIATMYAKTTVTSNVRTKMRMKTKKRMTMTTRLR